MKYPAIRLTILVVSFSVSLTSSLFAQSESIRDHLLSLPLESDEREMQSERAEFDLMKYRDPATGVIPSNIRAMELEFAAKQFQPTANKGKRTITQSTNWALRGPQYIGGRTRALAIDIANENVVLAGGTSGGVWRSEDAGASWQRTTSLSTMPSVTCLEQDVRAGKTKTWYYGTGEVGGNTAGYPLWLVSGADPYGSYYGNGIYKSTDDGLSWSLLASTASDTIGKLVQPFNYVNAIEVDPSSTNQDIVYAAVAGGIERSTNGGDTWTLVLGKFADGPAFTDVEVTSKGVVYALLGGIQSHGGNVNSPYNGFYRSTDGIHWTNISPSGWSAPAWYVNLAIPRSNENVVYLGFDDSTQAATLWKYTYLSGDGAGSNGKTERRSANYAPTGDYVGYLSVKPDDENTLYVGGVYLFRSTDAFATSTSITQLNTPHVDQNAVAFSYTNPSTMLVGLDGGIYKTTDVTSKTVSWSNLNGNYQTTQFYTVGIDHATPNDPTVVGGLQDNNTFFTPSTDPAVPWLGLFGGDGAACAIADGRSSYYVSAQRGVAYRLILDDAGSAMDYTRVDPYAAANRLFINPFILDPNNSDRMYFAGGNAVYRNDTLTAIPLASDAQATYGWKLVKQSMITNLDKVIGVMISTLSCSRTPANRLYYGTNDGRIFRVDNANSDNSTSTNIWSGKGFPAHGYVSSIAIDPRNADNILASFANYRVQSLFYSSDAGNSWTAVSGNLEEHPDGSGSGPSCRTTAIMHSGSSTVFLVGTSTGLYSTTSLNGMSTEWSLEAPTTIGNNIVNMIDTRESDGMVAVGTCGHGMISGNFAPASSVRVAAPTTATLEQNSPNPFAKSTDITFTLKQDATATLEVYDQLGRLCSTLLHGRLTAGEHVATWDATDQSNGAYYYQLKANEETLVGQMILRR